MHRQNKPEVKQTDSWTQKFNLVCLIFIIHYVTLTCMSSCTIEDKVLRQVEDHFISKLEYADSYQLVRFHKLDGDVYSYSFSALNRDMKRSTNNYYIEVDDDYQVKAIVDDFDDLN